MNPSSCYTGFRKRQWINATNYFQAAQPVRAKNVEDFYIENPLFLSRSLLPVASFSFYCPWYFTSVNLVGTMALRWWTRSQTLHPSRVNTDQRCLIARMGICLGAGFLLHDWGEKLNGSHRALGMWVWLQELQVAWYYGVFTEQMHFLH